MANTYSEKLKDPRWQKKRLKILERDNFTCKLCGDNKTTLHIHHFKYINGNDPWEYDDKDLVTLCKNCHIILEHNKNFIFKKVKIIKIENSDSKIYFVSHIKKLFMCVLDGNDPIIKSYDFSKVLKPIVNILNRSLRSK